ncbi:FAD-binding oxidoreductase [Anaerosporobacter faecicola]|uniref:FAD-binding oxidoreductase n=1 Tax=Anaerosporobacter faecicola TaxID=2718714 RepID=UPI00143C551D|nr:FAD-binding oxidoreductase [Anaerosporobacter faecicola]
MERWKGFREAKVVKRVEENKYIVSLYIKVMDEEGELPDYLPGQFIAVKVPMDDGTLSKSRQYTLSSISNGEYYRISVKREEEGQVSKFVFDHVKEGNTIHITAPAGKFVLKEGNKPVVLIGGGIGITPMLTMAMAAEKEKRSSHLIYSLPNTEFMAFRDEINKLSGAHVNTTIVYTRPLETDVMGKDYDEKGRLTKEWLERNIQKDAEVYFCGPVPFMKAMYQNLLQIGFSDDNISFEMFVPGVDIRK